MVPVDSLSGFVDVILGIAVFNSAATAARAWLFATAGLRGARHILDQLLASVLYAPMSFFDSTPACRIVNRFSSDTWSTDESLPFIGNIFLAQGVGLLGTVVVLAYATRGALLLLLAVLEVLYPSTQRTYRASSRELKRLDSVSRSPVYSHFGEVLDGIAVVRARGERGLLAEVAKCEAIIERETSAASSSPAPRSRR